MAAQAEAKATLRVLVGEHGVNKVYQHTAAQPAGVVLFFVGDQLEAVGLPAEVRRLQDPRVQAALMAAKFPRHTVLVVMPSRLEASYACFDHFLNRTTNSGEPLGYQGGSFKAASQMVSLLQAGELWLSQQGGGGLPVQLVGFSKGGVVLNQALAELAEHARMQSTKSPGSLAVSSSKGPGPPPAVEAFLDSIWALHFLDAGLNSRGAHLTDPQIISDLKLLSTQQQLRVFLHGTPRQWDDATRPWISLEKNMCKRLLGEAGVLVTERKYLQGRPLDVLMHFQILEQFDPLP